MLNLWCHFAWLNKLQIYRGCMIRRSDCILRTPMCRFYAEMYCLCGNACLTTHQVSFNTANTQLSVEASFSGQLSSSHRHFYSFFWEAEIYRYAKLHEGTCGSTASWNTHWTCSVWHREYVKIQGIINRLGLCVKGMLGFQICAR